jgi:hypothetical protein
VSVASGVEAPQQDIRAASRQVRALLATQDPTAAVDLMREMAPDPRLRPEALALFCTPGLSLQHKASMLDAIWQGHPGAEDGALTAGCLASLGRLGFAFPQWRFLAQSFGGTSLLERSGMRRMHRDTDVLHAPDVHAGEDGFGPGFLHALDAGWSVEYRRAYLLCSVRRPGAEACLLVRNSNHFFGRDRLDHPVYACFEPLATDFIESLDRAAIERGKTFRPWPPTQDAAFALSAEEHVRRVHAAIACLEAFDQRLVHWLFTPSDAHGGFTHFLAYVAWQVQEHSKDGHPGRGLPWLARIRQDMPPWFPVDAELVDAYLLGRMQDPHPRAAPVSALQRSAGMLTVMLSGPDGDMP